jgi:hypothetical protein
MACPLASLGSHPSTGSLKRANKDPNVQAQERSKVLKVWRQGYIAPSSEPILSLMNFFSVPRVTVYHKDTGKDEVLEIRMVYNGTSCWLNPVLWAPWFALPTSKQMIRTLDIGYWGADNDCGDMYLNFWLHDDLQRYCGVDLTALFPEELAGSGKTALWETWTRPPMGLRPSPYQAVQGALVAKRLALGNPDDERNLYQWSLVDVNLPGDRDYRPGSPWISKWRSDGRIAVDVHSYVDDERVTGPTELTWAGSSKVAKLRAFVTHSNPGELIYKLVTQVCWDKTKRVLGKIRELFDKGLVEGDQKEAGSGWRGKHWRVLTAS